MERQVQCAGAHPANRVRNVIKSKGQWQIQRPQPDMGGEDSEKMDPDLKRKGENSGVRG